MRGGEAPARDTIVALATAPGRGAIGVVRVSGPRAAEIAAKVAGTALSPRHAKLCRFRDASGAVVDEGLALYFPAPHSYTGEDVVEFQGHGGRAVTEALVGACLDAGARLAQPGEFTRRAFLAGRLDLAQAEAVADLIDAASREAARSAMRSLAGEFSAAVTRLRDRLVELRAIAEAGLDFPEEDLEPAHFLAQERRLAELRAELTDVLAQCRQGSLLREGIHVVLAGPPNVGKSSLLNRLAGEERAIVTAIPGTTRDALREPVVIDGVPVVIVDTAGLRHAQDEVERIGVERSRAEIDRADVVLSVADASRGEAPMEASPSQLVVFNKIDLVPGFEVPPGAVGVSARTGEGLASLQRAVLDAAGWMSGQEGAFLARERHVRALREAERALSAAAARIAQTEFFAEELRAAQGALGSILGEVTADDLLGEIFSRFCIGK